MNLKQYNPVKVKNPTSDGYSIKLFPRQSFKLSLTQIFDDEVFEVKLISDYLVLEDFSIDKKEEIYFISQKYDFGKWNKISTLFLGNVILTIKSKSKEEMETIRLCVFLNCPDALKSNVVTVVNPNQYQTLKIESNQIVEVVLPDTHHERWNLVKVEDLGMICARSETVFNDFIDVYDTTETFCPEPRFVSMPINPVLDEYYQKNIIRPDLKFGAKEYHFFTHLNLSSLKKAYSASGGNYPIGKMQFVCKTDDDFIMEERSLNIIMNLKGNGKRMTASELQAIHHDTRNWNKPFNSSTLQSVIHPNFNESIDLQCKFDVLYIEIPQPSVYFNNDKNLEDAFWASEMSIVKSNFKVKELTPRHVNGIMVQRFVVEGILSYNPPGELSFIGSLKFDCRTTSKNRHDLFVKYKNINLSLWKAKGFVEDRRKPAEFSYVGSGTTSYSKPNQTGFQSQQVTYNVELEQLHSDLEGIKIVSLDEIIIKQQFDFYGYDLDDLMSGNNQDHKKKMDRQQGICAVDKKLAYWEAKRSRKMGR